IATLNAASIHGHNAPQKLFVQSWPNVALSDTSPASQWVTDSAAGMTAIVTGQKTHNGVISQGPDTVRGKKDGTPLKTILEYAEERGLSTGVLSNVTITDATPAACYAQANDRKKWGEIFLQLFTPRFGDGVDILIGPGRKRIAEAVKELGKDLDEAGLKAGRPVHSSLADLDPDAKRGLVVVDGDVDLAAAAKAAIHALSQNSKGYFLMIESDAHTNHPDAGLNRLVAFDDLIREISKMVNMDETLLLFTADHSFDLRVVSGRQGDPLLEGYEEWKMANADKKGDNTMRLPHVRIDNKHTGEEVVAAALGPGAERVRGFLPNTELFNIMLNAYGWTKGEAAVSAHRD
ncbi:MAG: alkaline phosphatase, partial [Bryobacteraceae bacterium]